EYTILGIPSDEFPEFPKLGDAAEVTLPQPLLRSMIEQTIFAVSQSDSKPVHTGSLFEIEADGTFSLVSVDGYRLALRREKVAPDSPMRFVVPGRALNEISRVLSDTEGEVSIRVSKKHAIVKIGSFEIFTRLLEGDFLDYQSAIPKN
ncbi:MAG: DNA polymerase III subunit beta, partial [Oscillospiraceae bacterium]